MLCTVVWEIYGTDERRDVYEAIGRLLSTRQWSPKGIYAFWDPTTRELLYVGLSSNLTERFAQHNRLVRHSGGNKADNIDAWFQDHETLGLTLLLQSAAVQFSDDIFAISPLMAGQSVEISKIAEGQLIELHRMEFGHWPPWNGVGGSVTGAEWARPAGRPMIRLMCAAEESLFVARYGLRKLAFDGAAILMESAIHFARMQSLMAAHDPTDLRPDDPHIVEKIQRFLMLKDGKLVDDLDSTDEDIRGWVARSADTDAQRAMWQQEIDKTRKLAAETPFEADRQALQLIEAQLAEGFDEQQSLHSQLLLESGYMDRPIEL